MRPLVANISLDNIIDNYLYLKNKHKNKLLAVVKANAYGHGSVECSLALNDIVDGFAVAFLDEAIILRKKGINKPILLLEGVFSNLEYKFVQDYDLWFVIHNKVQYEDFLKFNWRKKVVVWLKLDLCMHRLGFSENIFYKIYKDISSNNNIDKVILISHLCLADNLDDKITNEHINKFHQICDSLPSEKSLANSAGILRFPSSYYDWGRAGLALYGASPLNFRHQSDSYLKPVMSFFSKIFTIQELKAGDALGYGYQFVAPYDMRVGIVACGYADGYPRLQANNKVFIDNKYESRIIGNISMDMLAIELNHPSQNIGSTIELWGDNISINEIAKNAQTIPYEILSNVKRCKKNYIKR